MVTENLLATVLSVFSAIAAVILVIFFGKFDRGCDFEFVYRCSQPSWQSESFLLSSQDVVHVFKPMHNP